MERAVINLHCGVFVKVTAILGDGNLLLLRLETIVDRVCLPWKALVY